MKLTEIQKDFLKELFNIGVGRATNSLNEILKTHVKLSVPEISLIDWKDVSKKMKDFIDNKLSFVSMRFKGSISGSGMLLFPAESAAHLVNILLEKKISVIDVDSLRTGTISEVGNILLNGVLGSISNIFKQQLRYSLPMYKEGYIQNIINKDHFKNLQIILAKTCFEIRNFKTEGQLIFLFEIKSLESLINNAKKGLN